MKRYSEAVLNGHPDKFCDIIADRIIREAYKTDPEAYGQVEVSVWSDQLFLTGGIATSVDFEPDIRDLIIKTGEEIGYLPENHIDVRKYVIHDHICKINEPPTLWTAHVNDQTVIHAYAAYDSKTNFLPPEHFAVMYLREQLTNSLSHGILKGHGPDGKLLLVINEIGNEWRTKTLLLTLQQKEDFDFSEFLYLCNEELRNAWNKLQNHDSRWITEWQDIKVLVNPNGALLNGGSDGDNGQTGRKLVMDFYGPRVPLGGGALYGKDLTHIDRMASFAARRFAVDLCKKGGEEVFIRLCYAPGMHQPLDISISASARPHTNPGNYFNFREMRQRMDINDINYNLAQLGTFYNEKLSFNGQTLKPCPKIQTFQNH